MSYISRRTNCASYAVQKVVTVLQNLRVSNRDARREETAVVTNVDQFIGRYATIAICLIIALTLS